MKLFSQAALLSGAITCLAVSTALSEEIDKKETLTQVAGAAANLEDGKTTTVRGGRVTRLVPAAADIADLRILEQPAHGHVSVNPDNTIALVLTRTSHVGTLSFRYGITTPSGRKTQHDAMIGVTESPQQGNWGTSENHYMLPVDDNDRVIVEPGEDHRKVYVSGRGLTATDIAAREGVSENEIDNTWLRNHPQYGSTPELALHTAPGLELWWSTNGWGKETSNWLLLERGYEYDSEGNNDKFYRMGSSGESPLRPLFVGAYGTGPKPVILRRPRGFKHPHVKNLVFQDVHFKAGFSLLGRFDNVMFDHVDFSDKESSFMGKESTGVTMRKCKFVDAYNETVNNEGGAWDPNANRESGFYMQDIDGVRLEGLFLDHNGWADDFLPDGSAEGGQPPGMFSHNMYVAHSVTDITMRDTINMRAASVGAQFRGGGYVEDNLFLDNNVAFNVNGGHKREGNARSGNFSFVHRNVVTQAAWRGEGLKNIGALEWGVQNVGYKTTLIDNIIAHANDPDDPADTVRGSDALNHRQGAELGMFYDDTLIWRWGIDQETTEAKVDALDPATLNTTTIQRYTADLLGKDTATVDDFGQYLRALDGSDHADATRDVLSYFRAGFGIAETARDTATTLRFVPDPLGDGVRWDNRRNWDSGDVPGTVAGDSVDLGGNEVVFAGDVTVDDLTFGPDGGLVLTHGRLQVAGDLVVERGARIEIDRAGQLWAGATTGRDPLALTVAGGRFVNAGAFDGPVTLTAAGGQTLLATGGSEFRLDSQSRIHIDGAEARIGVDGNGPALLRFAPGAELEFTAVSGKVSPIEEFYSGAFGDSSAVRSGIDLDGASLTVNLTDPAMLDPLILVDFDEVVGTFDDVTVQGLGDRDASVVINYKSDMVSLQLSSGTGQVSIAEIGTQDMIDPGNSEIRDRLGMVAE